MVRPVSLVVVTSRGQASWAPRSRAVQPRRSRRPPGWGRSRRARTGSGGRARVRGSRHGSRLDGRRSGGSGWGHDRGDRALHLLLLLRSHRVPRGARGSALGGSRGHLVDGQRRPHLLRLGLFRRPYERASVRAPCPGSSVLTGMWIEEAPRFCSFQKSTSAGGSPGQNELTKHGRTVMKPRPTCMRHENRIRHRREVHPSCLDRRARDSVMHPSCQRSAARSMRTSSVMCEQCVRHVWTAVHEAR